MKSKVLIVDDQADVRDLLRSVLEENYDVAQAGSGAALQKCFPQDPPDVVLLDVKLPDADGLDLLPQVKKRWPETEVIVIGDAKAPRSLGEAVHGGFDAAMNI